ncbi:MAG: hypothetical protein QOF85_478 [Solirubrobacterales bacterium]|nr:hypothetical protein [Solirubrobacterales bacterium]
MLLRLRRASLALLGLVGAVGLGLVIFISQLGWPGALNAPLPNGPAKVGTVHDAVALTRPSLRGRSTAAGQNGVAAAAQVARGTKRRASRASGKSSLGHSHQLASAPAAPPSTGVGQSPPSPSPTSEPVPVASTPTPPSPTTASVESAPTTGASKASNDSGRAAGLAAAKPHGQQSAAGKDSSTSTSKSTELASAKAHKDESAATPVAPTSGTPAPSSPAAAKEAADAAKASQGRH